MSIDNKIKNANTSKAWFIQGYACAVATLIRLNGFNDTNSDELFRAGIGSIAECKKANVDEYDLEILQKHYK